MLTKDERDVLKIIIKVYKNDKTYSPSDADHISRFYVSANYQSRGHESFQAVIDNLVKNGFISYYHNRDDIYKLEDKGKHYFKLYWKNLGVALKAFKEE